MAGVKITRGPWARGPCLGGRAPINLRGQNIENKKICDISRPGPADCGVGPSIAKARGPTGSYTEEPYFHH